MPRHIVTPAPVVPINLLTRKPYAAADGSPELITLRRLAHEQWFTNPRWTTPLTNLVRFGRVVEAFEGADQAETRITLRDEDWTLLTEIIVDPTRADKYQPAVQLQVGPLERAVLAAVEAP